jgi:hypothetical protein
LQCFHKKRPLLRDSPVPMILTRNNVGNLSTTLLASTGKWE